MVPDETLGSARRPSRTRRGAVDVHRAVGVDGTRAGWVAVVLDDDRVAEVRCVPDLETLVAATGDVPTAIDIPIGLVDAPRRAADTAIRSQLSGAGSSVFPAPCRTVVDAYRAGEVGDHATANALSRRVTGAGLSRQTWSIIDKIAQADAMVEGGAVLHEVHPELCFRLRAGRRLAGKRTWSGMRARLGMLRADGIVLPRDFDGADRVAPDDVVDAAVAAWTAAGLHHPEGLRCHPDPPTQWDRGRAIAIWTRS